MLSDINVQLAYQYFYKKQYGNEKYKYNPTASGKKLISKFLVLLKNNYKDSYHGLGAKFLFQYFHFQFSFWDSVNEIDNLFNKIVPSMLMGKVGTERFFNRNRDFDWLFEDSNYIAEKNIKKSEFLKEVDINKKKEIIKKDVLKARDYNTDLGFQTCILYTSLFDSKNSYCIGCKYRNECKEILRVNVPELYSKRGYDKKNSSS